MFRGRFRGYREGDKKKREREGEGFSRGKEKGKQKRRPFRWKGESRERVQYLRRILIRSFIKRYRREFINRVRIPRRMFARDRR